MAARTELARDGFSALADAANFFRPQAPCPVPEVAQAVALQLVDHASVGFGRVLQMAMHFDGPAGLVGDAQSHRRPRR